MTPSVEELLRLACQAEVLARKPGNVHPEATFNDLSVSDFLTAANAVAPILARAAEIGVGRAVHDAVVATREHVATNANLGICLLLAPCAAAVVRGGDLRTAVAIVLERLTVDDARWAYAAIRRALPGALGAATEQDVADEPTVTLLEAMRLAAERDGVARQYATGFQDVFETGLAAITRFQDHGVEASIVGTHLALMAARPDTLILRKCGCGIADESARRAARVLHSGWPGERGRFEERALDVWLRAEGHQRNPGTTADLVAATVFIALQQKVLDWEQVAQWSDEIRKRSAL